MIYFIRIGLILIEFLGIDYLIDRFEQKSPQLLIIRSREGEPKNGMR